jgi:hypothetical protein
MRNVLFTAVLIAASVPQAFADVQPLARTLGFACYGRVYDQAHLARHPRQRVTSILVRDGVVPAENVPGVVAIIDIRLALRGGEKAEAAGYCKRTDAGLACTLEGDAGAVLVSRRGADGLLVTIDGRFDIETARGFHNLAKGDDGAFHLSSGGSCR